MAAHDILSSGIWLSLTIATWFLCVRLARRLPSLLLGNPLVLGIAVICLLLPAFDVRAATYLHAVQPITFLAGLATVALAVPLWEQRKLIRENAFAMLVATIVATLTGIGTAWLAGTLLGLSTTELASIAPKMTTLAVALPLSESMGGRERVVRNYDELAADPQVSASEIFTDVALPDGQQIRMVNSPMRCDGKPLEIRRIPYEIGQDTREILLEIGFDSGDIDTFVAEGVVAGPK